MADDNFVPLLLQLLADEKKIETAITIDIEPQSHWDGQWQHCNLKQVLSLPFEQRYDLAIVNLLKQQLQHTSSQEIDNVLVRLRDLFAKKVIVVADQAQTKQLRALGFNQLLDIVPEDSVVQIWQFNILTYKHVPDWFNSKFWANPENWNKYRW